MQANGSREYAQGFAFGEPMDADAAMRLTEEWLPGAQIPAAMVGKTVQL